MSFAPPSPSDQGSNPFPPFNQTPPPGQQPPVMPNWASNQTFPGSPIQPSFRQPRGLSGLRWAFFAVPMLIGAGITTFIYLDAKKEAKDARDDVLASVEKSIDAIPDITVPEITVPEVTIPAVVIPSVSIVASGEPSDSAAPVTVASGAVVTVPAPAAGSTDLWSAEGVAAVTGAYEAAISGEPTRFLDLLIYSDYAFASAQDAATPTHVDEYPFRKGLVGASSPVQLIGDGDLEASLWSLADVDVTQIPRLVAEAPGLTGVEEPSVVYVRIERSVFIDGGPLTMKVYVDGPRGGGYVEYDAAGNLIQVMV